MKGVEGIVNTPIQPPFLSRSKLHHHYKNSWLQHSNSTLKMPVCMTEPPPLSKAFQNRTSQHLKTCCGGDHRAEISQLKGRKVKQVESFKSTPTSAFVIISMQSCTTLSKSWLRFVIALQIILSIGTLVDYTQGKKYNLDTILFRQDKI